MLLSASFSFFFFFNDTATTEIYTLSLHDALPILSSCGESARCGEKARRGRACHYRPGETRRPQSTRCPGHLAVGDRKSTRLNSSHGYISYAVFCLKKKKKHRKIPMRARTTQITYT